MEKNTYMHISQHSVSVHIGIMATFNYKNLVYTSFQLVSLHRAEDIVTQATTHTTYTLGTTLSLFYLPVKDNRNFISRLIYESIDQLLPA